MALKYWLTYYDVVNVVHRLELHDASYTGVATEVSGHVILEYSAIDELLDPFRGSGLRVVLDANIDLTFEDLFTETERAVMVIYFRDGAIKFKGWLNPEGWYEDFVNNAWQVSFDCVDGLGYLKDLSYVDATGNAFSGLQTFLQIIVNSLKRIGNDLPIYTSIGLMYDGMDGTLDVATQAKFNTDRYIKDDGTTLMSCEDVLKSILELFSAGLVQYDGAWHVFRPTELFDEFTLEYYRYDADGVALNPLIDSNNLSFELGSHVKGFSPHHCNSNQRIRNEKSLGAYRINYRYGLRRSLLENPDLRHDGSLLEGYTIGASQFINLLPGGKGIEITGGDNDYGALLLTSDSISVPAGLALKLCIKALFFIRLLFNLKVTDGTITYRYDIDSDSWVEIVPPNTDVNDTWVLFDPKGVWGVPVYELKTKDLPISGELTFELYNPEFAFVDDSVSGIVWSPVDYIRIEPSNANVGEVKGELHTFKRANSPSSKVDKVKRVFNGDGNVDALNGTIYKNDGETPTTLWTRKGYIDNLPILQLMGDSILRSRASTLRIFSGSVFGYFGYLSIVRINGFSGVYMPIKYRYNTKENVIDGLELKQLYGAELNDIEHSVIYDLGNIEEKPTVV